MRRRLVDGEVGVQIDNPEHMALLAEMLEIQADSDSAGDFVAYTINRFNDELRARYHENRANTLRKQEQDHE